MKTLREFRASLREAKTNHDLRNSPSRFGIALFDSIWFAPPEHWDSVVEADRLFLNRPYLAALESSCGDAFQMRYALLYDGRDPVAAVVFQIHSYSGEALGTRQQSADKPSLGKKVGRALRRATDKVSARVLICGNAFVTGEHALAVRPGVTIEEVMDGVAEAIYRIRRADKLHGQILGVLVKDFYTRDEAPLAARHLTRYGYREFAADPQMVVEIPADWKSFDEYVAAMTKKYRARVRSARKKGKDLERRHLDQQALTDQGPRLRELFLAVHEKAGFRIAALPENYFRNLAAALPEQFAVHGYFLADRLVGFTSSIRWGERMEGHFLGLDYEHNQPLAIYQNILYDDVAEAIECGCRELNLGRTALEIKSAIGAVARPAVCFMRHRNPVSNAVVKPLFGFVKPTRWTPRNPFG